MFTSSRKFPVEQACLVGRRFGRVVSSQYFSYKIKVFRQTTILASSGVDASFFTAMNTFDLSCVRGRTITFVFKGENAFDVARTLELACASFIASKKQVVS